MLESKCSRRLCSQKYGIVSRKQRCLIFNAGVRLGDVEMGFKNLGFSVSHNRSLVTYAGCDFVLCVTVARTLSK